MVLRGVYTDIGNSPTVQLYLHHAARQLPDARWREAGKGGGMIVRGGGQGAGGAFLESLCPGPPQLPERAFGGLTVPQPHLEDGAACRPAKSQHGAPSVPPAHTRHTTGIERPWCVESLPSHISKMVVSTVSGGGPKLTVDRTIFEMRLEL